MQGRVSLFNITITTLCGKRIIHIDTANDNHSMNLLRRIILIMVAFVTLTCRGQDHNTLQTSSKTFRYVSEKNGEMVDLRLPTKSPFSMLTQTIGVSDISIYYYRPNVNSRKIWGEVVSYDSIWRTGAENATVFYFEDDVSINGKNLEKGSYSFFIIPKANTEWTVIFNKNPHLYGVNHYDPKQDALRVSVNSDSVQFTETMTFEIGYIKDTTAKVNLKWAERSISFDVLFDVNVVWQKINNYLRSIDEQDNEVKWTSYVKIANYVNFTQNKDKVELAILLIDKSLEINETFENLKIKSDLMALKGEFHKALDIAKLAHSTGAKAGMPLEVANLLEVNIRKYEEILNQ